MIAIVSYSEASSIDVLKAKITQMLSLDENSFEQLIKSGLYIVST